MSSSCPSLTRAARLILARSAGRSGAPAAAKGSAAGERVGNVTRPGCRTRPPTSTTISAVVAVAGAVEASPGGGAASPGDGDADAWWRDSRKPDTTSTANPAMISHVSADACGTTSTPRGPPGSTSLTRLASGCDGVQPPAVVPIARCSRSSALDPASESSRWEGMRATLGSNSAQGSAYEAVVDDGELLACSDERSRRRQEDEISRAAHRREDLRARRLAGREARPPAGGHQEGRPGSRPGAEMGGGGRPGGPRARLPPRGRPRNRPTPP